MSPDLQNSVVLITSRDPSNTYFGTGFVIHQDEQAAYLLTCAHVVQAVGSEKLEIRGIQARVIASNPEEGADLAVLRIEKLLDVPPLPLYAVGEQGKPFSTAGFQSYGKRFLVRELHGTLGEQVGLETRGQTDRIRAWDLKITDDYQLQRGYSGSPVVDANDNVIGVVNTRQGEGKKGLAVSITALEKIWPEMPPGLFRKLQALSEELTPQLALPGSRPFNNLDEHVRSEYTGFVGRDQEREWLRQRLLSRASTKGMAVVGMGGVGKTALVFAIADEYCRRYKDLPVEERFEAIIWVAAKEQVLTVHGREDFQLSELTPRTLQEMYTTIARTLEREDITREVPENRSQLVREALKAQRTLLVVDNLESVKDDRVKTFLRGLPASTTYILTSRQGAIELGVELPTRNILPLDCLSPDDAKSMIREKVAEEGIGELNETQKEQVATSTFGLPLSIKLSIARLANGETFDQVQRWLATATGVAGDLASYCLEGQIDVARQRDPHAEKLLWACSLFERDAGASREALGFIVNLSDSDRDTGLTLLHQLSLLGKPELIKTHDRFWMLPLVQEHARATLNGSEVREMLRQRWLSWLLDFAQNHGANLNLNVERASEISSEYLNILGAVRWCCEQEHWEHLIGLVEGIWSYLYLIGLFGELQEMLEAAKEAAEVVQQEQKKGLFLRLLGQMFRVQGQTNRAVECLAEAEKIARDYNTEAELGRIWCMRAILFLHQNELPQAKQWAQAALEVGKQLDDLELKILVVHRLSEIESKSETEPKRERLNKALDWLAQGERWARELQSSRELAWTMFRRGSVLLELGETTEAEFSLKQSLAIASSWNEQRLIAHNQHKLAQVYLNTAQMQPAIQRGEVARDLYERLGMTQELTEVEQLLQELKGKDAST